MAALCQTPVWQLCQFTSTGDVLKSSLSRISFLSSEVTSQGFFEKSQLLQISKHLQKGRLQLHGVQAEAKDSPFTEKSSIKRTSGGGYFQGARSTDLLRDEKQVGEVSQCVDKINSVTTTESAQSDARASTKVPSGDSIFSSSEMVIVIEGVQIFFQTSHLWVLAQPLRLLIWMQGGLGRIHQ